MRGALGENENLVEKISIVVYDIEGVVQITDLKNVGGECSNNNNSAGPGPKTSNSNSITNQNPITYHRNPRAVQTLLGEI